MKVPDNSPGPGAYVKSLRFDQWEHRPLPRDFFRAYLDLGANAGFKALQFRVFFPRARVCAIEPCPHTYAALEDNLRNLNAETACMALGDGRPVAMTKRGANSLSTQFRPTDGQGTCPSKTLCGVIEHFQFDVSEAFIKCDVEGAERYLLGDHDAEDALRRCKMIGFELHSDAERDDPTMAQYHAWIAECFGRTHTIDVLGKHSDTHSSVRISRI